jgi:hypothetical protein
MAVMMIIILNILKIYIAVMDFIGLLVTTTFADLNELM